MSPVDGELSIQTQWKWQHDMILKRWVSLWLKVIDDCNTNLLNPSAKSMGAKWQVERLEPMKTVKEGQNLSIRK